MTALWFLAFLGGALAVGGWVAVWISEKTVDRDSDWNAIVLSTKFNDEIDRDRWRWGR